MARPMRFLAPIATENIQITESASPAPTEANVLSVKEGVLWMTTAVNGEVVSVEVGSFEKINALAEMQSEPPP